jgi:hypothetical protein
MQQVAGSLQTTAKINLLAVLLQQYCRSGKLSDKQWAAAGKAAKR